MERANPLGRAFTRLVGTSTAKEVRGRRLTAVFVNEPAYGPVRFGTYVERRLGFDDNHLINQPIKNHRACGARRWRCCGARWRSRATACSRASRTAASSTPGEFCVFIGDRRASHDAQPHPPTNLSPPHSPLSAVANPDLCKHYFVFLGRLLGFALRERLLVPLPLPTVLFKVRMCSFE